MKIEYQDKIAGRLLERLASRGVNAALEYGLAVSGTNPHVQKALISSAPEPLRTLLEAAIAARLSRRLTARTVKNTGQVEFAGQARGASNFLDADLEQARKIGQASVYLASLRATDRDQSKATKQELEAAISLRRNCIRSTKVKEILGCTVSELSRWASDGRLPVMFRRRMPSSTAVIMLDVRHWDSQQIEQSRQNILQWRDEDEAVRRR